MTSLGSGIFRFKVFEYITYPQTVTAYFVSVCRTDSLTCRSHFVLTFLSLIGSIENTMRRHNQMGLLGDMQARMQIVSTGFKCLGFLHEEIGSQNYTITDNVNLSTLEDSRWNRTEHILLSFKFQCMASIRTTLETGNNIVLGSQNINYLTFSFVAPLQTEQDIYFTFVHNSYLFSFYFLALFFLMLLPFGNHRLTGTADAIYV